MKKIEKSNIWLLLVQAAVWAVLITALPLATFLGTHNWEATSTSLLLMWQEFRGPLIVYFINFYILGPYLFFRQKYWIFALCNLLLILGVNYVAIGILHFIRVRQIRQQLLDEKAKSTEAELAWLKSQINPHFLFNTLNNISSLTQIDADAAQNAIAQLSDLLRYAMYETNKKTVPIAGEVEFMRNYTALMKLRCNEKTIVNSEFRVQDSKYEIAPLLFVSLIENAFKHGVSSSRPSKIDIQLKQSDNRLVFICDNTNYPKDDTDRSGSGIGLENTRRRLELMYQGRYTWEQTLQDDIYHIKIGVNSE